MKTIIKDITGEYIAIITAEETALVKNITEWIDDFGVENLDETSAGWIEITSDEAENIISAGNVMWSE